MQNKNNESIRLINPFIPTRAATSPNDFFGRTEEMEALGRGLRNGHIAIQGGIGIGKTSLLEKLRYTEEGFDSKGSSAESYIVLGNKTISNLDDAAKLVLQEFVQVDSIQKTKKLGISKILAAEKGLIETTNYFSSGRCLGALKNVILKWSADNQGGKLILASDLRQLRRTF